MCGSGCGIRKELCEKSEIVIAQHDGECWFEGEPTKNGIYLYTELSSPGMLGHASI